MKRCLVAAVAILAFVACTSQSLPAREGQQIKQPFVALPLIHLDVTTAAKKLKALLGEDSDIVPEVVTNTILIRASAKKTEQARAVLQRIDVAFQLRIFTLEYVGAGSAAEVLRALLVSDRGIYVTADEGTNQIIILATPETIRQAKKALRRLDGMDR